MTNKMDKLVVVLRQIMEYIYILKIKINNI